MIGSNISSGLRKPNVTSAVTCETLETRSHLSATGTVTGILYNDDNGNRVRDAGETLNVGKTVYVDANQNAKLDAGEKSTVSDGNGRYTLSGLAAGIQHVTRVLPSNIDYQVTTPEANVFSGTGVNVVADKTTTLDIGSTARGTAEINVSTDNLPADAVVYIDKNLNGKFDAGETKALKLSTGKFIFALPHGSYRFAVTTPAGTRPTFNFKGYADDVFSDASAYAFYFNFSTKPAKATVTGILFNDDNGDTGKQDFETLNIGKTVFLDANNNGKLDSGERSTTSDSNGRYTFSNVDYGEYHVRRVLPSGYQTTTGDSLVDIFGANDFIQGDIGSTARAIVQGRAFFTNVPPNDGPGNSDGIDGKTIFADLNKNGLLDAGEPSFVTGQIAFADIDGDYRLTLAPGSYRIATTDNALKPVGYATKYVDVTLKSGQLNEISFSKPFGVA